MLGAGRFVRDPLEALRLAKKWKYRRKRGIISVKRSIKFLERGGQCYSSDSPVVEELSLERLERIVIGEENIPKRYYSVPV